MKRSYIVGGFTCLTLVFLLSSCAHTNAPKVTLVTDNAAFPLSGENGTEMSGLYADITERVTDAMPQFDTTIVAMNWKKALSTVASGDALGLIGTANLPNKRPWLSHYSAAISEEEIVLICAAKHKQIQVSSFPNDFKNMLIVNIAGFDGWFSNGARSKHYTNVVNYIEAPTVEIAFDMVATGNVDCSFFESTTYKFMIQTKSASLPVNERPFIAMVYKKENIYVGFNDAQSSTMTLEYQKAFNETYNKMREAGKLDDLYEKYSFNQY